MSWGVLLLPFTNQFAARRGWHLNLWKRLGTVLVGIILVGLTKLGSQTQPIAVSHTPSSVSQAYSSSVSDSNPSVKTPDPKPSVRVKVLTPAFAKEGDFEVWYSVVNNQTQPPEVIDEMKQKGQMYFILPNETVEVLETKECLQGVNCYLVNTQGASIMKGVGGPPFKPLVSNSLWIPVDYVRVFAGDASSESSTVQPKTSQPQAVSTPRNPSATRWGTLHSNDNKIKLRTGPGTVNKAIGYGVNGDHVQIIDSSRDSGDYTWYKVKFPKSGAEGWIAGHLIETDSPTTSSEASDTTPSSQPNETLPAVLGEANNIPVGTKCSDFATQSEAQAALPANPKLDRDKDGVACESLP